MLRRAFANFDAQQEREKRRRARRYRERGIFSFDDPKAADYARDSAFRAALRTGTRRCIVRADEPDPRLAVRSDAAR